MAAGEKRPNRTKAEPDLPAAGRGPAGVDAGGPLFDPLFDPLPSERAREDGTYERGPEAGQGTIEVPRRPKQTKQRTPKRRKKTTVRKRTRPPKTGPAPATSRRVKRTVRRIDPFSVLKISLFFYAFFLIIWLGFVAVLYWIIESMGFFQALEDVSEGFVLNWGEIDISLALVERWAFLIGLTGVVVGSLINAFLAFLYNVASDLLGGVEMTFVERDTRNPNA